MNPAPVATRSASTLDAEDTPPRVLKVRLWRIVQHATWSGREEVWFLLDDMILSDDVAHYHGAVGCCTALFRFLMNSRLVSDLPLPKVPWKALHRFSKVFRHGAVAEIKGTVLEVRKPFPCRRLAHDTSVRLANIPDCFGCFLPMTKSKKCNCRKFSFLPRGYSISNPKNNKTTKLF